MGVQERVGVETAAMLQELEGEMAGGAGCSREATAPVAKKRCAALP